MKKISCLKIDKWCTDINYPEKRIGSAELKKINYSKGLYHMENVCGYKYFNLKKRTQIQTLKIKDKIVMVDDPLHWIGMQKLAENSKGSVLVAGLGLGLIVYHLVKNKNVNKIEVYEINKDVIKLVTPFLPKDKRIKIIEKSFFTEPYRSKFYETIIIDLWVGNRGKFVICGTDKDVPIFSTYIRTKINSPRSKVFVWGIKDSSINPACIIKK